MKTVPKAEYTYYIIFTYILFIILPIIIIITIISIIITYHIIHYYKSYTVLDAIVDVKKYHKGIKDVL